MQYINLLTSNERKLEAARSVFSPRGIIVRQRQLKIPEIQADTSLEIARWAAEVSYAQLREPVMREDHSLTIDALGIPGPYVSYMYRKVDVHALTRLLAPLNNRAAHFTIATVYVDSNGKAEFSYDIPIMLDTTPKGPEGKSWERIFRFPDEDRVFAEYPWKARITRFNRNFTAIADSIVSRGFEGNYDPLRRK